MPIGDGVTATVFRMFALAWAFFLPVYALATTPRMVATPIANVSETVVHEAYIWQRQWDDELRAGIAAQAHQFVGFRYLAAQLKSDLPQAPDRFVAAHWVVPNVSLQTFPAALEVVPVIRLPGAAPLMSAIALDGVIRELQAKSIAQGRAFTRVEIDFDSAESKLAAYVVLLQRTRALLPKELHLDVTALPVWLDNPAFSDLEAVADRITLQVHAVGTPKSGLFDPRLAESWLRKFDRIARKPFDVALPAYGAKLLFNAQGKVIGVEHESELATDYASSKELQTAPKAVIALLDMMNAKPVKNLRAWRWFRLPLERDQRAWSPQTLSAVIARQPLRAKVQVLSIAHTEQANAVVRGFDLRVVNSGNLEGNSPLRIAINPRCQGEGIGGYQLQKSVLVNRSSFELRPGRSVTVAWVRCENGQEPLKLRP